MLVKYRAMPTPPCELFLGKRGLGKTVTVRRRWIDDVLLKRIPSVTFDIKGSLVNAQAADAEARGMGHLMLHDIARKADKMLCWDWYVEPAGSGFEYEIQRQLSMNALASVFWAKRGMKTGETAPNTKKYLDAAIAVWSSTRLPWDDNRLPPLWWMRQLFRPTVGRHPGAPEYDWMMRLAADRDAVWKFQDVALRAGQSRIQYESEAGATSRLIDEVKSVVLWGRCGRGVDWIDVLKKGMHVGFDLSGIPLETARVITVAAYAAIQTALRKHFAETGEPLPVVVILEEMGAVGSVTPLLLDGMREQREHGYAVWGVTQTPRDLGAEKAEAEANFMVFSELCGVVNIHKLTADIDLVAPMVARPTFDPLAVHFSRTRRQAAGQREVARKTTSKTKTTRGDETSTGETEGQGTSYVTEYEDVSEDTYETPQVQYAKAERKIVRLGIGQMIEVGPAGVREVDVVHPGEPWPLGGTYLPSWGMTLTEKRTTEAIERIRSLPLYRTPAWTETPIPEEEKPERKDPPKEKKPAPRNEPRKRGAAQNLGKGNGSSSR